MSNETHKARHEIAVALPLARRTALALLLALPLAACGRKGPPEPPEDYDPKAPRRYPTRGN